MSQCSQQFIPLFPAEFDRQVKILERKLEMVSLEEVSPDDVLPDCYNGQGEHFTAASSVLELRLVLLLNKQMRI